MQLKFISILSLFIFAFSFSQEKQAEIKFEEKLIDYGEIEFDSDGKRTFKFTNIGNAPLVFNRISSSCGCTVPEWSREPVMPGKTTKIKVRYDTKRVGPINKSVTLTSNATNEPTMVLRIKGNVLSTPTPAAPEKTISEGAPVEKK